MWTSVYTYTCMFSYASTVVFVALRRYKCDISVHLIFTSSLLVPSIHGKCLLLQLPLIYSIPKSQIYFLFFTRTLNPNVSLSYPSSPRWSFHYKVRNAYFWAFISPVDFDCLWMWNLRSRKTFASIISLSYTIIQDISSFEDESNNVASNIPAH